MAKKLTDIIKRVEQAEQSFYDYLDRCLDDEVLDCLNKLSKQTEVFIFSGLIRNYFLNIDSNRDVDIVLAMNVDIESLFSDYQVKINSFGGYKILIGDTAIDLWYLENTWALKHQPVLNFELEKYIPYTAFFNFSSIIYSVNKRHFHYTEHFLRFLQNRNIDVVYKPNANYSLCVVNTLYYSEKYHLPISKRLKNYVLYLHKKTKQDYREVQLKHFGNVLFTNEVISAKIMSFIEND